MIIVADESVDAGIVEALRSNGHTVHYVAELDHGMSDPSVLLLSNEYEAPLLTADKDFGELVYRQRLISHGVILLRLAGLSTLLKVRRVLEFVSVHAKQLERGFAVLEPAATRIRNPLGAGRDVGRQNDN